MHSITLLQSPRLTVGSGCVDQLYEHLISLPVEKIHFIASNSVAARVRSLGERLLAQGRTFSTDFTCRQEPTVEIFEASLARATDASAECVVGFGGGSVLDLAKLVAAFLHRSQDVRETFGIGLLGGRTCPLICVPTTSGTGSEVSPNAILLDESVQLKKGVVSKYLVPDAAFIDPELTLSVPSSVTANTGLDTLTHCIEAYTNKFAHPVVDTFALQGIRLCAANLAHAVAHGDDLSAREGMSTASMFGGFCLGPVNTAAVHALAYPLGGEFHVPHGLSNAVLLPEVFRFNASASPERHAQVAVALGVQDTGDVMRTALLGADRLEELSQECGLKFDAGSYGIEPSSVPRMAQAAAGVTRLLKNNPRPITEEQIAVIYRKSFGFA